MHCSPTRQHHLILMSASPERPHRTKPISITCHGDGPTAWPWSFSPSQAYSSTSATPIPEFSSRKPQLSRPVMYRTMKEGGVGAGVRKRTLIRLHIMHCFVFLGREVMNALSLPLAQTTYLLCLKRYLLNSALALRMG